MRSRTQNCKDLWLYWLGDNVMEKACLCGLFITSMITRRWLSQSWSSWLSWWWSRRWWWWTPNCQGRHTSAANHAPLTTWWTVPFNLCNHHYQHYIHHSGLLLKIYNQHSGLFLKIYNNHYPHYIYHFDCPPKHVSCWDFYGLHRSTFTIISIAAMFIIL